MALRNSAARPSFRDHYLYSLPYVPRDRIDRTQGASCATTDIVSPESGKVKGWNHTEWGDEFTVDVPLDRAAAKDYSALLLPGGVINPGRLRRNEKGLNFVRQFFPTAN